MFSYIMMDRPLFDCKAKTRKFAENPYIAFYYEMVSIGSEQICH